MSPIALTACVFPRHVALLVTVNAVRSRPSVIHGNRYITRVSKVFRVVSTCPQKPLSCGCSREVTDLGVDHVRRQQRVGCIASQYRGVAADHDCGNIARMPPTPKLSRSREAATPAPQPRAEPKSPPYTVGFYLVPEFPMMAFASAIEPLRAANRLTGEQRFGWRLFVLSPQTTPRSRSRKFWRRF